MTPLPRGTCFVCGADVALRKNGVVREHKSDPALRIRGTGFAGTTCPGSGQPPAEAVRGPIPAFLETMRGKAAGS